MTSSKDGGARAADIYQRQDKSVSSMSCSPLAKLRLKQMEEEYKAESKEIGETIAA